ncbi:hypothetical protein XnspCFBP7698_16600 [Xanthomonas sp. CFBP 7698]|nr:hypothetical protein XnspCFBP7698_16600 [Xanthomonas sp. CFBP 7698]
MLRVVAVGLHVTCFASTLRFGGVGRKGSAKLTGVAQKTHARSAFVQVSFGGGRCSDILIGVLRSHSNG